MYKCVRIVVCQVSKKDFLREVVQKNARALSIEGYAQFELSGGAKIVAYGHKENVDSFVDVVYREADVYGASDIEVEALSKDKDFRGVFRVIE